jgi:hypothetical protein
MNQRHQLTPLLLLFLTVAPCLNTARSDKSPQELIPIPTPARGSAAELFNPRAKFQTYCQPVPPPLTHPTSPPPVTTRGEGTHKESNLDSVFRVPVWLGTTRGDRERRKLTNSAEGDWAQVASEFIWQAPEAGYESPFERGAWSTEDTLSIPVTGPIFLFGEVAMNGQYAADQNVIVAGRTGIMCRVPVTDGSAIEVRGGPTVQYNDALRLEKARDQAALLWELRAKWPLLGTVGLEYTGLASPALTPEERSKLNSDLALAIPVSGGKLKLGAKHQWEDGLKDSSASLTQWYLGFEIGR